jgi:hypothetical protein
MRNLSDADRRYAEALVPHVPGHELPPPWPVHIHGPSYIVDEMCQCGLRRSLHEDTQEYGRGPSFDGTCQKFKWHGWVESAWPPGSQRKAERAAKGKKVEWPSTKKILRTNKQRSKR